MSAVWSWLHKKRADKVLQALGEQYGAENVKRLSPLMKAILNVQMVQGLLPADTEWTFDHAVVERLFLQAQKEETDESRTAGEDLHGGADPVAAARTGLGALSLSAISSALHPEPPAAPPDPEFLSEVVIGCRIWRLLDTAAGIHCQSLSASTRWPPRTPLKAECQIVSEHSGLVPSWGCACGLYAWRLDWRPPRGQVVSGEVTGLVGLWGRVIQHQDGWRGQYGYPLAFFAPPVPPGFPTGGVLATLAERYAVPLISEARDRWPAWLRRGEPRA